MDYPGCFFVTRMKDNALYEVVGEKKLPENRNILKDPNVIKVGQKLRIP